MGRLYTTYLESNDEETTIFGCKKCLTHLSLSTSITPDTFRGRYGAAFLVSKVINVEEGKLEAKSMVTGHYKIRDIKCPQCETIVGWKFIEAMTEEEKYKEGKYVLESTLIGPVK